MSSIIRLASIRKLLRLPAVTLCLALVTLGSPGGAQSQSTYGRTYTKAQVERLIRNVEQSAQEFRRDFDRWLDRSPLDGQRREDEYNQRVNSLASMLSTLRSNFNQNSDWWQARPDMRRVLREARAVNTVVGNREVGGRLDRQWSRMRTNLNRLAEAFNLPPVDSSYYGGNQGDYDPGNYPEQVGNVPEWALGTFRGSTNSGPTELTIASNGVATARSLSLNSSYTGRYVNGVLYFDWGSFNLVRDGRGISTVEIGNTRNRTSYRRVGSAGNQGNYGQGNYPTQNYPTQNYPTQIGSVPNWAVGTFRGSTDSGESEITISSDGGATARSLNLNALYSGRYANGVLTFDWGSFNVVRDGRGITTIEIGNPRNRTSYRRVD